MHWRWSGRWFNRGLIFCYIWARLSRLEPPSNSWEKSYTLCLILVSNSHTTSRSRLEIDLPNPAERVRVRKKQRALQGTNEGWIWICWHVFTESVLVQGALARKIPSFFKIVIGNFGEDRQLLGEEIHWRYIGDRVQHWIGLDHWQRLNSRKTPRLEFRCSLCPSLRNETEDKSWPQTLMTMVAYGRHLAILWLLFQLFDYSSRLWIQPIWSLLPSIQNRPLPNSVNGNQPRLTHPRFLTPNSSALLKTTKKAITMSKEGNVSSSPQLASFAEIRQSSTFLLFCVHLSLTLL